MTITMILALISSTDPELKKQGVIHVRLQVVDLNLFVFWDVHLYVNRQIRKILHGNLRTFRN